VVIGLDPNHDEFTQSVGEGVLGYVFKDASALPDKLIFQPPLKLEIPAKRNSTFPESLNQ
jgi:hypothetical protein